MSAPLPDLPTAGLSSPRFSGSALCAETDPDAFFPVRGGSTRAAKRVCARCPIRPECLSWALATGERYGVWGGLSERERQRLRPRAARPATASPAVTPSRSPHRASDVDVARGAA